MWTIMVVFIWFISILLLIIYWCWLFFMCKMYLSFWNRCLCDFLVPNHMHQWHMCSYLGGFFWDFFMHVLFLIFCLWSIMFSVNNILTLGAFGCSSFVINICELSWSFSSDSFQYCFWLFTDVDYLSSEKCSYHSQLMLMWFSCTGTYQWIAHTLSSLVIYWCWHIFVWKMFQNFNIAFDYLLMLTICHLKNVLIILNWCLCDFLVLKHIDKLHALHLHWTFTDGDIFWCVKWVRILILLLIIYWCWLFFMCKMFLSFSIDVYVIFLYWKISMNCMHFIFIGYLLMLKYVHAENFNIAFDYLLMLTIFHVQNILIILD